MPQRVHKQLHGLGLAAGVLVVASGMPFGLLFNGVRMAFCSTYCLLKGIATTFGPDVVHALFPNALRAVGLGVLISAFCLILIGVKDVHARGRTAAGNPRQHLQIVPGSNP